VLKKIVIVAERAAGAGLTENAGFPMMKDSVVGLSRFVVRWFVVSWLLRV
jgi:hypothetical protein